ncbi:MAG TPA: CARDB domain-containing protein, partial [Saprospiraceae bacterium]
TYTDIQISSLAPHETMTVDWVINAPVEPSWNPMRVTVDFQNTITETNEFNNTAVRPFICGDFSLSGSIVAYSAASPNPSYEGQGMGLYGTAYYSGTALPLQDSSCAGATVTFTIIETNQTFVVETSANGFFSAGFIAPPPGTYTIEGEVTDYTLTGYFTTTFTVIEPPVIPCALDYVCSFTGDFSIIEGESVAPQFIVSNIGCDPADVTSSASALREGGSPANEEFMVPALGGGGTQVYNLSPITYTNPGTYTLYGAVDQGDGIVESREDNNVCIAHISVVPNMPDIAADYHAPIDPLYLCFSQGLTFSFSNQGVAPTGQFNTRLEIVNANNEVVKLETVTTTNLNYQQSGSIGFSGYMFPATGLYTAKVICDFPHPPGVVTESNEGNNTFEISFQVIDCGVNLVWHSICEINQGVTPINPTNPGTLTVKRRLINVGTEAATDNIPVTFEVDGNVYAEMVPPLSIGESAQVTMTIPTPVHGDHDIEFSIDPDQTIPGEDPGGNVASEPLCWDFFLYHDEDCSPGSIWNYPYLVIDQPVTFDIGLINYGLYKASPVHVSFEVSGPGISGWLDLGEVTMNGPINKTCGCPVNVSLPYSYSFDQVGLYSVRMIADPEGVFTECDESNNQIILQVEVINVPDLKVLSQYIDPSEINPDVNEEINFNITYQNIGMSNVQETFELLLLVDEVPVDSVQVPGLITGGFNTVSIPNTWSSILPGLHIVRAIIDADDEVMESTNSNNETTRAVIVGAAANLFFAEFTHTAPSGSYLDITGTVDNAGNLSCTADLELYYVDDFGDEQWITTIPFSINGSGDFDFSYNWYIEDENTTLIGRITNVSVLEYEEDDNEAYSLLSVISLVVETTDENCIGSMDGTASIIAQGGTGPYSYQWNIGQTGSILEGGAGHYVVTVTDVDGNVATAMAIIESTGIEMQTYYRDADNDGYGDPDQDTVSCGEVLGYVSNSLDCQDADMTIHPGAIEICDGLDNNCNGSIDDADPGIIDQVTWYIDIDQDGYGYPLDSLIACFQPEGYVNNSDDCDDMNSDIHPGAEICNGMDDDCDGLIDDGLSCQGTDGDGDGIEDAVDNCPSTENPNQQDSDC